MPYVDLRHKDDYKHENEPLPQGVLEEVERLKKEFKTIENIPDRLHKKLFAVGVINAAFGLIKEDVILIGETACDEKDGKGYIHLLGPKINNQINAILRNLLSVISKHEYKIPYPDLLDVIFCYKPWSSSSNIESHIQVLISPGRYMFNIVSKEQALKSQCDKG